MSIKRIIGAILILLGLGGIFLGFRDALTFGPPPTYFIGIRTELVYIGLGLILIIVGIILEIKIKKSAKIPAK